MKKLFLTLIAIAAIVACDKDALDQDVNNINVLEQAEEINASVDIDYLQFFNNFVSTADISNVSNTKNSSSTSKGFDDGDNWFELGFFTHGGVPYVSGGSEDATERCFSEYSDAVVVTYTWNGSDTLIINNNGAVSNLPVDEASQIELYNGFFASTQVFFVQALPDFSRAAEADLPDVTLFDFNCITPVGELYGVTRAPFPLSGFLATILPGADLTEYSGASANYAGTSEREVRTAVERDIMDSTTHVSTTPLTEGN